ncbi:MAG: metallophosphoesterase family protein [Phycisphaerae bacterium]|nr:metallophosphoesterase family protein [Phycisphaerae bacterium]
MQRADLGQQPDHASCDALGILSDSHGQRGRVRRALELLHERGVRRFVHLGDVGDGVLDDLAGLDVTIVFGNCDDACSCERYARDLGLHTVHPGGVVECGGKRIGLTHGHLVDELERLFLQRVDYLLHGHTHQRSDAIVDNVRIINPGALHRATPCTVAILTPATGTLETLVV